MSLAKVMIITLIVSALIALIFIRITTGEVDWKLFTQTFVCGTWGLMVGTLVVLFLIEILINI